MQHTTSDHDARATIDGTPGTRATTARRPERTSSPKAPTGRRGRRSRRLGVLAGAAMLAVVTTGCFPTDPVETWVPDFDRDGQISEAEVDLHKQDIINRVVAAIDDQRRATQRHPFLTCIRHHESDRGAYPHTNGYGAHNPSSSASGAYQFLDSTWRNVSARSGHGGYARASHAPWYVQDAVALWMYNNGGRSAWAGSGC
jgi:hypothetical protein